MSLASSFISHLSRNVVSGLKATIPGQRLLEEGLWWNLSSISVRTALLATRGHSDLAHAREQSSSLVTELSKWVDRDTVAMEFGSGLGLNSVALSRHCKKVIGIDISRGLIRQSRRLARNMNNVSFFPYDGVRFPAPPGFFNFVFSVGVFERIPKRSVKHYLDETLRVLSNKGYAYLYFLSDRAQLTDFTQRLGAASYYYYSTSEAISTVSNTGFEVKRVDEWPMAHIVIAEKSA